MWVFLLSAVFFFVWSGSAWAQGMLSGANTISLSVLGFDPFRIELSNSVNLSYRIGRLLLASHTVFSHTGLPSQNFRLQAPLGEMALQGSMSFAATAFTRATLAVAGGWEGLSYVSTWRLTNLGSSQTPSYAFGGSFRFTGSIPELGRLAVSLELGRAEHVQTESGCEVCFKRMRISWGGLALCGGIAQVGFIFGEEGLEAETAAYNFSFCDFNANINLRFLNLLELQGFTAGVNGHISELSLSGNFAFDASYAFQRAVWSLSGPFFRGTLSSTTTFDATSLLSWDLGWNYQTDHCSLALASSLEIITFDWRSLVFGLPSIFVNLTCDLICCGDLDLGSLTVRFGLAEDGLEGIGISYSLSF